MTTTRSGVARPPALRNAKDALEQLSKPGPFQALRGDLGMSYRFNEPVLNIIVERLPVSLTYGLITLFLVYTICIPLGVLKAIKHRTALDNVTSAIVFTCFGAAYGTAKAGVGISAMGVLRPDLIVKSKFTSKFRIQCRISMMAAQMLSWVSLHMLTQTTDIIPVIMAGIIAVSAPALAHACPTWRSYFSQKIYGLVVSVLISGNREWPQRRSGEPYAYLRVWQSQWR